MRRIVLTLVVLVVVFGFFRLAASRRQLVQAKMALADGRTALARGKVDDANASFDTAERRLRAARAGAGLPLGLLSPIPVLGSPTRAVKDTVKAGLHGVAAGRALIKAEDGFPINGRRGLDGSNLASMYQGALDAKAPLAKATRELKLATQELRGPAGAILPPLSGPARSVLPVLAGTERQLQAAGRSLDLLASLTAPTADARILILSQDTLEARPGGGFIGTFGILHFAHGTVALERYGASGDLQRLTPPMPVPTNFVDWLGGRPWELSNVNWWPNFPLTGYLAKEMVRREGGGDVAGVVAITQEIMEPLIAATGPVNVPGYSPVVAKDLEDRILQEVDLKQPPDIPQHKFLALLSTQLFDRILHLEPTKVGNIATVASQAAATGDMQAWFADPAQEAAVTGTTWSGALPQNKGDFLLLADANMKASKANKDLERDVTYTVDRDDKGQLVGHVHAVFKNNGLPSKLNPTYLGYVRVYTPAGSRLLGGVPWTRDNDKAVGGKPRDEGRAPDGPYQVFSTVVQADPQKQATFDMRYVLPDSVDQAGHYNLTWVRQTGAGNDRLSANILGHSTPADPQNRVADISVDLNPHGLRGFLHRRWIFRQLGF